MKNTSVLGLLSLPGALPRSLVIGSLTFSMLFSSQANAAEGGYSNYILGSYGDFGMALAPTETWTPRNDVYSYGADINESVRSGTVEVGADFISNGEL